MHPIHARHFEYEDEVVFFDPSRKHVGLTLADDDRTVVSDDNAHGKCVYGKDGYTKGKHSWCFEVANPGTKSQIIFGVSAGATRTDRHHYPGIASGGDGVSLYLNQASRYAGGGKTSVVPFKRDAALVRDARYVRVLLDVDARCVTFFADGVCLGVCAGPDVITAGQTWYPVVALYETATTVKVAAPPAPRPAFDRVAPIPAAVVDAYLAGAAVQFHSAPAMQPLSPALAVGAGGAVMKTAPGDSHMASVGTAGFTAGLHYWSFTVPSSGVNGSVMVGVAGEDFENAAGALYAGHKGDTGVALYVANAHRYCQDTSADTGLGAAVHRATRVGLLLDMDRRTVTAFADGVLVGTIAEENAATLLRGVAYRPAVSVYQMGQIVVPDVLVPPPRPPHNQPQQPQRHADPNGAAAAAPSVPSVPSTPAAAALPTCPLPDSLRWEGNAVAFDRPRISPTHVAPGLSLRFGNHGVEHARASAGWLTAVAEAALPSSGVSFFACRVLNRGAGNIIVGLVAGSTKRAGPLGGCVSGAATPGTAACPGVGVKLADGTAWTVPHGSTALPGAEMLKQALHVGIALDMNRRVAQVFADGSLVAVCAGPDVLAADRYFPCVACHDPSASVVFAPAVAES